MKSLKKITGIITLLFISVSVFAQKSNQDFTIKLMEEKSFFFATNNMPQSYLEIIFKDENGLTVFSEYVVHPDEFERTYNLSELKEGNYYLLVKGETNTQILTIANNKKSLSINENDVAVVSNSAAPLLN